MNPAILKLRRGVQPSMTAPLPVPSEYTAGVGSKMVFRINKAGGIDFDTIDGAPPSRVAQSSDDLLVQMEDALAAFRESRAAGTPTNDPKNNTIDDLDAMAEHIRRAAREAADPDGGAVIADVAYALLRLPDEDRLEMLKRAGRPEIFEPLLDELLGKVPLGGVGTVEDAAEARGKLARARVAAADEADATMTRNELPLWQRPSSIFVEPDQYSERTGQPIRSSQTYKKYLPSKGDPLSVPTRRGNRGGSGGLTDEDINDFGMAEASPQAQGRARSTLAGDQNAQVEAIKRKTGDDPFLPRPLPDKGNPRAAVKKVIETTFGKLPKGIRFANLYTALRPDADLTKPGIAAASDWVDSLPRDQQQALYDAAAPPPPRDPDSVLTVGTSQGKKGFWGGKRGRGAPIDDVVGARNRSQTDKMVEALYRLSDAVRVEPSGRGLGAPLRPVQGTDATIDLDKWFPWVRLRFAEVAEDGTYSYPSKQLNPRWVAGAIQGIYGIDDPAFISRVEPLIARSLERLPAQPKEGTQAARYFGKAVMFSPEMERVMKIGPSAEFPEPVYIDAAFPQPAAEKPLRTFAEQQAAARAQSPQPEGSPIERIRAMQQKALEMPAQKVDTTAPGPAQSDPNTALERIRRMRQGLPGSTDQSSIYTVPPQSPTRSLLV